MWCKQMKNENFTYFIGWFQFLYSQINLTLPNVDVQRVFIEKLQPNIRAKILLMKYPSFIHLCMALHDYQNSVS